MFKKKKKKKERKVKRETRIICRRFAATLVKNVRITREISCGGYIIQIGKRVNFEIQVDTILYMWIPVKDNSNQPLIQSLLKIFFLFYQIFSVSRYFNFKNVQGLYWHVSYLVFCIIWNTNTGRTPSVYCTLGIQNIETRKKSRIDWHWTGQ